MPRARWQGQVREHRTGEPAFFCLLRKRTARGASVPSLADTPPTSVQEAARCAISSHRIELEPSSFRAVGQQAEASPDSPRKIHSCKFSRRLGSRVAIGFLL